MFEKLSESWLYLQKHNNYRIRILDSTMKISIFLSVLALFQNSGVTYGARILFLMPLNTKSETHLFNPLAYELVKRGHVVTLITSSNSGLKNVKNLTEINPHRPFTGLDFIAEANSDPLESRKISSDTFSFILSYDFSFVEKSCHDVYKNKKFREIMDNADFDLVITSASFNECFHGYIHKLGVSAILYSTLPIDYFPASFTGLRMPPSFVPSAFLPYTDKMSFSERFLNTIFVWLFASMMTSAEAPFTEISRHYLEDQDIPPSTKIMANISLIFSNTHFALNAPRPLLPDIVEIGGIHCRPPKPLDEELQTFMDDAKDGVILFSLGSVLKTSALPEKIRQMMRSVFSQLKQKVILKWESDDDPKMPNNVKLVKWVPQQDILGHPNTKLFITHGGLLSITEGAYHGVPLIGLPVFVDQDMNMMHTERLGFGIKLEIMELSEAKLAHAISSILHDPTFSEKAKHISSVFKDQPMKAMERAVYWVEYLLGYNGAPFLRSGARDLNWFQYHSYDVIATIAITMFAIFYALKVMIEWCCGKMFQQKVELYEKKRK